MYETIEAVIGIGATVDVRPSGSVVRSRGEAVRVIGTRFQTTRSDEETRP